MCEGGGELHRMSIRNIGRLVSYGQSQKKVASFNVARRSCNLRLKHNKDIGHDIYFPSWVFELSRSLTSCDSSTYKLGHNNGIHGCFRPSFMKIFCERLMFDQTHWILWFELKSNKPMTQCFVLWQMRTLCLNPHDVI